MKFADFKEKLKKTGLSEQDFSDLTHTPIATIRGWAAKRINKTPKWVSPYLELYEQNRKMKTILEYYEGKISHEKN